MTCSYLRPRSALIKLKRLGPASRSGSHLRQSNDSFIFSAPLTTVFRSSTVGCITCWRLNARSWRVNPAARSPRLCDFLDERTRFGGRDEVAQQEVAIAADDRQQVVEVVGHAARQPSDRLHFFAPVAIAVRAGFARSVSCTIARTTQLAINVHEGSGIFHVHLASVRAQQTHGRADGTGSQQLLKLLRLAVPLPATGRSFSKWQPTILAAGRPSSTSAWRLTSCTLPLVSRMKMASCACSISR